MVSILVQSTNKDSPKITKIYTQLLIETYYLDVWSSLDTFGHNLSDVKLIVWVVIGEFANCYNHMMYTINIIEDTIFYMTPVLLSAFNIAAQVSLSYI